MLVLLVGARGSLFALSGLSDGGGGSLANWAPCAGATSVWVGYGGTYEAVGTWCSPCLGKVPVSGCGGGGGGGMEDGGGGGMEDGGGGGGGAEGGGGGGPWLYGSVIWPTGTVWGGVYLQAGWTLQEGWVRRKSQMRPLLGSAVCQARERAVACDI